MNAQEHEILSRFLSQLRGAQLPMKDAQADALIRSAVSTQPDAAYWLVQRALVAEQAVEAARAQIAQLQWQVQALQQGNPPSAPSRFLGNSNPWGAPAAAPNPAPIASQSGGYAAPQAAPAASGGGLSSFLGTVATTAVGVAAGSFLFQGVENLLHSHSGHDHNAWMGPDGQPMAGGDTVINNYYLSDDQPNDAWASAQHPASGQLTDYDAPDFGADVADEGDTWV